jgi:hypothetical protein
MIAKIAKRVPASSAALLIGGLLIAAPAVAADLGGAPPYAEAPRYGAPGPYAYPCCPPSAYYAYPPRFYGYYPGYYVAYPYRPWGWRPWGYRGWGYRGWGHHGWGYRGGGGWGHGGRRW